MNLAKEKRLNPCQGSDAYIQRKRYFIQLLKTFTLAGLVLVTIYFVGA